MGDIKSYEREKLICGLLYGDEALIPQVEERLKAEFGEIDLKWPVYRFSDFSPYYDAEMGGETHRIFYSFERLADPSALADIKVLTNSIEDDFRSDSLRPVNLDPGLLSHGRLCLATTKSAGHRIALSRGIYAELTLFYARKAWHEFPWTYMDFKSENVQAFLSQARSIYMQQRK
ncbi:MAG: DUF4416 family protein [Oscillospiraceae bacterium]|nr:DUF4416 family protein [Oscillospiraceae bacterium]